MHEVGIHMAADGKLAPLLNRANLMVKHAKGDFFDAVRKKMERAGETSAEEAAAYLVEAYENDKNNAPPSVKQWFKDFMAAVRAWLYLASRGLVLRADQLTAADIAAVARANARGIAYQHQGVDAGESAPYTDTDATNQPTERDRQRVEQLSAVIARNLRIQQPKGESAYRAVALPDAMALQSIGKAWGKRVIGFGIAPVLKGTKSPFSTVGGVSLPSVQDAVFINISNEVPHLSVLGHELAHHMRRDDPKAYDNLVDAIRPFVRQQVYRKEFGKELVAAHLSDPDLIKEEFVGQVLSDGFMEPSFWNAIGKESPSLLASVVGYVQSLIDKANSVLGLQRHTEKYLTDFDRVMQIAGEAMAKYASANSAPPPTNGGKSDGDAMFSRQRKSKLAFSPEAKKQAIDTVRAQVDGIKATWTNTPDVVVAFDMNDPVIPEAVRKKDQQQRSTDAGGAPEGFFHKGTVYLMASKLPTARDTTRVLFHEALGHYGLRGVFGESLQPLLRQIVTMRKQEIKAKIEDYKRRGVKHISPLVAAEEMLAEMAENAPDVGFARRAVAAIKQWLKVNIPGFDGMKFTDDDIVSLFIVPARRFVEEGNGGGPDSGGGMDSGIRFSRAGGDGKPPTGAVPAYFDVLGGASGAAKEGISDRLADWRGMGMQVLGRRQIVDLWHKLLPQLSTYDDLVQRMDAEKNDVAATADNMVRAWGELDGRKFGVGVPKHPGMERKLADVMHDATLRGVDADPLVALPSDANVIQKAAKADLNKRFEALTPEAQAIYRQARDDYKAQHQAIRKALKERIERSAEISPDSKRTMIARMEEELGWEKRGVYFPLARFGKYVVVAKDANGKTVSVSRAESLPEAKATRLLMMAKMPVGTQVSKVYLDAEFNAARDGVGKGFAADLIKSLRAEGVDEGVIDSVGQLYLKSLPDLSWAKHGIHRKGTAGFSDDARRAYAQNVIHGASHLAKLRYADKLGMSLLEMQNHIKLHQDDEGFDNVKAMQVYDEMTKRHENLMNPKSHPFATFLTSFGFVYFLGLSPASAAVNLSQTALLAYPLMGAKWGYDKAGAALMAASAEVMRAKNDLSNVLSGDELKAFQRAVADGTIDVTQAHDLAGIAGGEDQRVTWALRPVMRAASFMFHHAERFNRQATFIAAYRLAKAASPSITEDQAFEQAKKATYDGHFDMSASNVCRRQSGIHIAVAGASPETLQVRFRCAKAFIVDSLPSR